MYPTAKIAVTGYGNVIPQFVDSKPGSLCSTARYFYAYELFKKGGAKALAVSLITRRFDKQVGAFQQSLYQYAAGVLQQLNTTIQAVASSYQAIFVPRLPATTSVATTRRAPTAAPAPRAKHDSALNWHRLAPPGTHFDFRPHTLGVPQQPTPGCNVVAPLAGSGTRQLTLKIGPVSAHATMKYSFFAVLNDFPHLTPNGEAALAGSVRSGLGL
jgi:hypothetical protein